MCGYIVGLPCARLFRRDRTAIARIRANASLSDLGETQIAPRMDQQFLGRLKLNHNALGNRRMERETLDDAVVVFDRLGSRTALVVDHIARLWSVSVENPRERPEDISQRILLHH
jgi:hypothetical protein